jgi:phosphohistidine phosphatase SixA
MLLAAAVSPSPAKADDALWEALRSGEAVALIRHALAPGTGDPGNFTLGDCSTQRNLNDVGRDQAARIGKLFRENGIEAAEVLTSQWCRCRETAELMELGAVEDAPFLNSFFRDYANRAPRTEALREWMAARNPVDGPAVLITHQVNISAYTDSFARSGEIVVVRVTDDGRADVLGSIETL